MYIQLVTVTFIKCISPQPHTHTHQAPCEAEAQCAAMVAAGVVYGVATEDMDSLTFGSSIMLRHLTASEAK